MAQVEDKKKVGLGVGLLLLLGGALLLLGWKKPPIPPENITLSGLVIEPGEVYVGEPVSISVVATNVGETAGSYEVSCEVV